MFNHLLEQQVAMVQVRTFYHCYPALLCCCAADGLAVPAGLQLPPCPPYLPPTDTICVPALPPVEQKVQRGWDGGAEAQQFASVPQFASSTPHGIPLFQTSGPGPQQLQAGARAAEGIGGTAGADSQGASPGAQQQQQQAQQQQGQQQLDAGRPPKGMAEAAGPSSAGPAAAGGSQGDFLGDSLGEHQPHHHHSGPPHGPSPLLRVSSGAQWRRCCAAGDAWMARCGRLYFRCPEMPELPASSPSLPPAVLLLL